jgi:hypothetical protein
MLTRHGQLKKNPVRDIMGKIAPVLVADANSCVVRVGDTITPFFPLFINSPNN